MEENKQAFAEIMGAVFRNYTNEPVDGISYTRDDDGFEAVTINFEDGTERTLNVTEKSCLAIMQDVYKALAR